MPLTPGENVRLRRREVLERARLGLTWLASMAAVASAMIVWFLIEVGRQGAGDGDGDAHVNLVVNGWHDMLAFGMAALSSAAVMGAAVMRTLRDTAEIG